MSDNKIILYDVPCKTGNVCWSPNVWKSKFSMLFYWYSKTRTETYCDNLARIVLNYKNIPYETEWVDFPDIKPLLQSYGVHPKIAEALGAVLDIQYTLPTIRLPNQTFVMDSATIAARVEDIYPEPSLHLELHLHEKVQAILPKIARPLLPELMPKIRDNLVTEHGTKHWVGARENLFGMSIDEFCRTRGGEQAWVAAKPGLDELKQFVRSYKNDNGPFVLGSEVSYADFVIAALLISVKGAGQDVLDNVIGGDEGLMALWDACQPWLKRDI